MKFRVFRALLGWLLISAATFAFAADEMPSGQMGDYRLGTGDKIRILVHEEPDLSLELIITDAGYIAYPFLGDVKVSGRTPQEVEASIVNGLSGGFLVSPKVHVSILEYRRFFVNGEVKNPGGFAFLPGLTVRKAVSLAGGMTDRGSEKKIFVIRDDDPKHERQKASMDDPLRPGDILTVEQTFF